MSGKFDFYATSANIPGPIDGVLSTGINGNQMLTATVTTSPQAAESIIVNYSGDTNFERSNAQSYVECTHP